jgi:hypothetical protein
MGCPPCDVSATTERADMTARGYRRFRCHTCERRCADWSKVCNWKIGVSSLENINTARKPSVT